MTSTNFTFFVNTSNAPLRGHLEKYHTDEYVQVCKDNRWPALLPKLWQKITEASIGSSSDPDGQPHPKFSRQTFLHHIINFIVADDQVCLNIFETYLACLLPIQSINVIECPEFRDLLLLLRQDLRDKDIPRRTKLRESIVQAWEAWFRTLRQELSVCSVISGLSTISS
jgi:hypothetical protein